VGRFIDRISSVSNRSEIDSRSGGRATPFGTTFKPEPAATFRAAPTDGSIVTTVRAGVRRT
jgi:hypothetical protein